MELLKKNWLSILCGVVALLAIISTFWPLNGWTAKLQSDGADRRRLNGDIDRLTDAHRALPVLPSAGLMPDSLDQFPTPDVTRSLLDLLSQVRANNTEMLREAVAINRHQPLVADMPTGVPGADQMREFDFATAYVKATTGDALMRVLLSADENRPMTLSDALKKLDDPNLTDAYFRASPKLTDDQIAAKRADQWEQIKKDKIIWIDPGPKAEKTTVEDAQRAYLLDYDLLPRREQMKHAGMITLYLEPTALKDYYQNIVVGGDKPLPSVNEVWEGQMGLWVLKDIAQGINRANQTLSDAAEPGRSADVLHSAVKRIVSVDHPGYLISGKPDDLTIDPSKPLPNVPAVSPTGRVTNSIYEVLVFEMKLDVDARKIPQILQALEYGHFVTVLQVSEITVLDPAVEADDGFILGDQPVAEITVKCEDLMLRQWEKPLMPTQGAVQTTANSGNVPGMAPGGGGFQSRTVGAPSVVYTSPFLNDSGN